MDNQLKASCKHLTYQYPAYSGCTLEEAATIAAAWFVFTMLVGLMVGLYFQWVGAFMLTVLFLFMVIFFKHSVYSKCLKRLGQLKENKPHGYVLLKARKLANQTFGMKVAFVTRSGHWRVGRRL